MKKVVKSKFKELNCNFIEFKIYTSQNDLLKNLNLEGYKDHKIRFEKKL